MFIPIHSTAMERITHLYKKFAFRFKSESITHPRLVIVISAIINCTDHSFARFLCRSGYEYEHQQVSTEAIVTWDFL